MAAANTLAYHDTATITAVKSFLVQAPAVTGPNTIRNFLLFPEKNLQHLISFFFSSFSFFFFCLKSTFIASQ
jgi:hypothetical protein